MLCVIASLMMQSLVVHGQGCQFPDPAVNFKNQQYVGEWFEIGKIQTKGGAFFEKDCVCTELNVAFTNLTSGDATVDNDCRSKVVDGPWTNITGILSGENILKPGKWEEEINGSFVNYTVIYIDEDSSIEYDCGTSLGVTNYCIHVLSRGRTMPTAKFNQLMAYAQGLGLNTNDLPITMTTQAGC